MFIFFVICIFHKKKNSFCKENKIITIQLQCIFFLLQLCVRRFDAKANMTNLQQTSQAILVCDKECVTIFKQTVELFCGKRFGLTDNKMPRAKHIHAHTIVYTVASRLRECLALDVLAHLPIHLIQESTATTTVVENDDATTKQRVFQVSIFELPILLHNVGVYWRKCFPDSTDYFAKINEEHKPQQLTLHANPQKAYRTGFYATKITQQEVKTHQDEDDALYFRLLRCSSNFTGGTDNLKATDDFIFAIANRNVACVFPQNAQLNHVLVQIYHNTDVAKAKIAPHSDKTEDFVHGKPNVVTGRQEGDGLIAFATFYKRPFPTMLKQNPDDALDFIYKQTKATKVAPSALTQLHFQRKKDADTQLVESFDVLLYPNSMFVIDLETNRNYTHEIVPSKLPAELIPTRCGYVMRCSAVKAFHKEGQTYYEHAKNKFKPLQPLTPQKARDLKDLYALENTSSQKVEYPDIDFSMNAGDYGRPLL